MNRSLTNNGNCEKCKLASCKSLGQMVSGMVQQSLLCNFSPKFQLELALLFVWYNSNEINTSIIRALCVVAANILEYREVGLWTKTISHFYRFAAKANRFGMQLWHWSNIVFDISFSRGNKSRNVIIIQYVYSGPIYALPNLLGWILEGWICERPFNHLALSCNLQFWTLDNEHSSGKWLSMRPIRQW